MSTCAYCGQRKGKRSCPALAGAICSRCCGQHRLVEVACPSGCVHLGGLAVVRDPSRAVAFTQADYCSAWDKLQAFAVSTAEFSREVAAEVGDGTPWDPLIALAYVHYGHRGADGSRLIERFIVARARTLSAGEAAATVALQRARASLFEVAAVRTGVGLDVRDVVSGETSHVRDVTGSARLRARDVLFAWVIDFPDHREFTGAACVIERADVERVRAALQAELPAARTRWPGIADADLVGSITRVVFRALDAARDEEDANREDATEPPSYTFDDDRDDDDDPGTGWRYDANTAPDPELWLAAEESHKLAAIEAHHRALGVELPNARLHAMMHAIVENQLAAGAPAEARATLERLVAAGVARHEAVHAIGSVVADAVWSAQRGHAVVDRDAMVAALARLDPDDWRDGEPDDESPAVIPPLAHEVMYRRVPGLRAAVEHAARNMRQCGWTESTLLDPPQLLDRSTTVSELLKLHVVALLADGWAREAAIDDANLLSIHAFSILSYELHRRKTFWVDESLAFMLGHTRLDVRGEGLRLPFPCFALVFTDRETLGLAEAVARTDPTASVRGLPLRGLTVYATQLPTTRGALGLHLAFLLDADTDSWPWLITRDLEIRPDDTLDDIIESRFADAVNPDPVFRTPELRQLVQLVVNAILFAASSPAWPVVGATPPKADTEPASRPRRRRAPPAPRERSEEQIWHLPGKIPIRQVRALRQLQRDRDRGALFSRFMVRGHWRRAPDTWHDRSPRWIAPYWKGPPLGDIVERDYALKP